MGVPMAALAAAAPHGDGMPLLEAISGIFGSISMASWICLMVCKLDRPTACCSRTGLN